MSKKARVLNNDLSSKNDIHTPLCNTGCGSDLIINLNICFDYLKLRFEGLFHPEDETWFSLLDALGVEPSIYTQERAGLFGYTKGYTYDACVKVYTGGEYTQSNGMDTTLIEMTGQACRDFDQRFYENENCEHWLNLFKVALEYGAHCTRIDCAIDDFAGKITIDELKYRIFRKLYSTSLRRIIRQGGLDVLEESPNVIQNIKDGITFYFGGRTTKQLCIYDKKAERAMNEYDVECESWLRWECRFYREAAQSALLEFYAALKENDLQNTAAGVLGALIDFKEKNRLSDKDKYRAKSWKKWTEFLNTTRRIKIKNQAREELSMARKRKHMIRSYGKTFSKELLAHPNGLIGVINDFISRGIDKLENKDVAEINYILQEQGIEKITDVEEAVEILRKMKVR